MVLLHQILFNLAIAEVNLMWISAQHVPSLHRVESRYLKLITSSSCRPFMLISALMLFMLWVMILLFSVLTSIPYTLALSVSLLVRSWSLTLLLPIRLMSLVNCRLHVVLPPMEMDVWWSWSVSYMIFSGNKLNKMGESKHPWWISTGALKNSPSWLFKRTALLEFSYTDVVPDWLEPVLPLCCSLWGPATGLLARLCQTSSWSLWSCGTEHAGVVGGSLSWLKYWRSVLLCSSPD